jgi:hypothetical protein
VLHKGVDKAGTTPDAQVSAVAALDEPIRRRLYDYVVGQPDQSAATRLQRPWRCPTASLRFTWIVLLTGDYLVSSISAAAAAPVPAPDDQPSYIAGRIST